MDTLQDHMHDKDAVIASMLICEMATNTEVSAPLETETEDLCRYGRYLNKIRQL